MKKYTIIKTIQLILIAALAVFSVILTIGNRELFHLIANDSRYRVIAMLLWAVLVISFIFIFMDFLNSNVFKKDMTELNDAVHSDPLAGIANRYSCDAYIEQYIGKSLPTSFVCIMIDISNIVEINTAYGHASGNTSIRDFSAILRAASLDLCFVGRNGGNKFLAIFENGSEENTRTFTARVDQKLGDYNKDSGKPVIAYRCGIAAYGDDGNTEIIDLITLANKRVYLQ